MGPRFWRFWTATTIDAFGSWLLVMAVPLHVYQVTGSVTSTAVTLAVEAAPALLIGLWAGALVDRWPLRRVLVLGNLVAAAGVALLPVSVYGGLLVESLAVCFLQPALAAALPAIVGTGRELVTANSWTSASGSALRMLGPPGGAFLVTHGDFGVVVALDVASYLIAAVLLPPLPSTRRPALSSLRTELRAGLRVVARTRMLSGLVVSTWVFWAANAALTVRLVALAQADVGWLIAGLGLGYLLGSAIARTMIFRYATRTVLTVCHLAVGSCFLVAFSVPALWAITLAGVPGAVIGVAVRSKVQSSTPSHLLGRVSTVLLVSDAGAGVAGALAAPLLSPISLSVTVLAAAVIAALLLPGRSAPAGVVGVA